DRRHVVLRVSRIEPASSRLASPGSSCAGEEGRQPRLDILSNRASRPILSVLASLHVRIDGVEALEAGATVTLAFQEDLLVSDPDELELGLEIVNLTLRVAILAHQG